MRGEIKIYLNGQSSLAAQIGELEVLVYAGAPPDGSPQIRVEVGAEVLELPQRDTKVSTKPPGKDGARDHGRDIDIGTGVSAPYAKPGLDSDGDFRAGSRGPKGGR